jgi:uncharacterized membrane protein
VDILGFLTGKKRRFFSQEEEERMVDAIRSAETMTSGEIRVFVESRCRFINPMDRAMELFADLEMTKTKDRNAVLLYFAMDDKQMAILADEGIYRKMGQSFWENEVKTIMAEFKQKHFTDGICHMIKDVGDALQTNFPYQRDDQNELADGIVFGK